MDISQPLRVAARKGSLGRLGAVRTHPIVLFFLVFDVDVFPVLAVQQIGKAA
jgi:nitrate reductase NapE component